MRDKKGRFVRGYNSSPETQFKKGNEGNKAGHWKGGRRHHSAGYIIIYCPGHPRAYRNEVLEHIVIVEKKIGRYLKITENVHHINGIKNDNRPENLIVLTRSEHSQLHAKQQNNRIGKHKYVTSLD